MILKSGIRNNHIKWIFTMLPLFVSVLPFISKYRESFYFDSYIYLPFGKQYNSCMVYKHFIYDSLYDREYS
ncbi:conserved integral membrane protein [Streptococcus equi subsp. zooepidemicus]|nr:conserved integral membrane protein [Streptococcus equi subsp. zooepidemicus]